MRESGPHVNMSKRNEPNKRKKIKKQCQGPDSLEDAMLLPRIIVAHVRQCSANLRFADGASPAGGEHDSPGCSGAEA